MSNKPLVSIIIPTFNRAHLIGETLDSVLAQTYNHWECIVVDDGSTDGTAALLDTYCAKDPRIQYYQRPEDRPKGANACRNYGKQLSKGQYLLFLDSDDLLLIDCLFDRVSNINDGQSSVLISNTAKLFSNTSISNAINVDPFTTTNKAYLLLFLSYRLPWTIMDAFWDKRVLKEIWFNEGLQRFQDVDFHIRVLMKDKVVIKRQFKTDTLYRHSKAEKDLDITTYNQKVVDSYEMMIRNATEWALTRLQKQAFKRYCYIIYRDFIFTRAYKSLTQLHLISAIFKVVGFSVWDCFYFYGMAFYAITGLSSKKGTGSHRFIQKANRYFDNLIEV
ncbi:glycosyltransferase family 2 protein [Meridianimaribacter flavus]|uniref:Glycosyltransferase involved in cell wall biosynthesis n=1 Tax=Meridianimaribacter flavus TaxID=571115 RepID=A0ABY2G4N5_9FLAO|nr:glycosyltransferase family 2 protein [Meridianimaribacter flavus]TDY11776.1 glycosyltransferase involved in cell wall biosynthesis [Meridianimaribacter flavus]